MFKILFVIFLTTISFQLPATEQLVKTEENKLIDDSESMNALSEMTEEERESVLAFFSLDWKETGTYKLSTSNSSIALPEGYHLLIGNDVKKLSELNKQLIDENLEAVVLDANFDHTIYFSNYKSGYISLDDWDEIEPKMLLDTIIENTKKENIERQKIGGDELQVIGWVQEPTLDKNTNTIFWAIEIESKNDGNIVNSVALRLCRDGFTRVVWVSEKTSYTPFGGELDIMLRAHCFDSGFCYNDYSSGDRVASYGIATLVAATLGGKIVKAGGLAILFKKLSGFIFAGVAAFLYKFKNIFKLKKDKE